MIGDLADSIVMGAFAPVAGLILDRFGARAIYGAGMGLIGTGFILCSLMTEPWQLVALAEALPVEARFHGIPLPEIDEEEGVMVSGAFSYHYEGVDGSGPDRETGFIENVS